MAYQALEGLHSSVLDPEVQLEDLPGVPFEVALFETLLAHQVEVDLPYSWEAAEIAAAWVEHPWTREVAEVEEVQEDQKVDHLGVHWSAVVEENDHWKNWVVVEASEA